MSIFAEFLRRPWTTGAVAASSARLARHMVGGLGLGDAKLVVELGPGTGVFTDAIMSQLRPGARLVAVEINPRLATALAKRWHSSHAVVDVRHASAEVLPELVDGPVDAVVSGLPWALIPTTKQLTILNAVTTVLAAHGRFSTFAYRHASWSPPARRFNAALHDRFAVVEKTPVIWTNLPPAFAYRAALPVRQRRYAGDAAALHDDSRG
jgi:phospholipid N-methyltransferase